MNKNILALVFSGLAIACFGAMPQLEGFRYGNDSAPTGNEWDPARDVNCVKNLALNKEMPRATFTSFADAASARKVLPEYSRYWKSLNGAWKFHWCKTPEERPKNFFKAGFDASAWDTITVPSNWNIAGIQKDGSLKYGLPMYVNQPVIFEHKVAVGDWKLGVMREPANKQRTTYVYRNEVGSYLRDFEVPADWNGREIFLNFDGVDSFFYVWVNGKYVGFSKNSRDPACFDISEFVKPGEKATVAVEVYRNSDGSFLEAQDMYRLPGIFRTVSVYSTPKVHIRDFVVIPQGDKLNVTTDVRNFGSGVDGCEIVYSLYAQKELYSDEYSEAPVATATVAVPALKSRENLELPKTVLAVPAPKRWSAEDPNLYLLIAELKQGGKTIEAVSSQVGFCEVEIRDNQIDEFGKKGRYLYVNGKTVKLKGVNRHESHPERGHAVTREDMEEEVMLMKRGNINHVRNSHYPTDPYFYFLCNKYGIYLEDEANIESHQYYYGDASLSHPIEWRPAHVARVMEMAHRNVNQPSIVIWSLGNEAGPGDNFKAAYQELKKFDASRPVQYERNNNIVDMGSNQYPSVGWVNYAAQGHCKQPFHISEYAHSMGNAMGNLKDYWDAIESSNYICGGAIWDWVDQALYRYDPVAGRRGLVYGGQFGEVPHDRDFVCNGVIFADRSPKPQYFEVKKVYQYIGVAAATENASKVEVFNKYYFKSLDGYMLKWTLTEDGKAVQSGVLPASALAGVAPRTKKVVEIPFDAKNLKPEAEYFLNVQFCLAGDVPWAEKDYVQADEQLLVKAAGTRPSIADVAKGEDVELKRSPNGDAEIRGCGFAVKFSGATGTIESLQYGDDTVITAGNGPKINAHRVPVSNDNVPRGRWARAGLSNLKQSVAGTPSISQDPKTGICTLSYPVKAEGQNGFHFNAHQIWTVYPDGSIELQTMISCSEGKFDLPRLGYEVALPAGLDTFAYYGRGPIENYADRKSGSFVGRYQGKVADNFVRYILPQEMGNREEVRWCALLNKENKSGVAFVSTEKFCASALPISQAQIAAASNAYKLEDAVANSEKTTLLLSSGVRGLGGASCGPDALDRDKVFSEPTSFGFIMRPLKAGSIAEQVNVAPAGAMPIAIARDIAGVVTISAKDPKAEIYYSVDGGKAQAYKGTIPFRNGGKIAAWLAGRPELKTEMDLPRLEKVSLSVAFCSNQEGGEPADNLVDNDPSTIWHTAYSVTVAPYPHWVDFDTGEVKTLKGVSYLPRSGGENGDIKDYEIYVSLDGKTWGDPVAKGSFPRTKEEKKILFPKPLKARYVRFRALSSQNGQDFAGGAEFGVLGE